MIETYLVQRCTLETVSGSNDAGEPSFEEHLDVPCKFEETATAEPGIGGQVHSGQTRVFVALTPSVAVGSRVTEPGGARLEVQKVSTTRDLDGAGFQVLTLK